MLLLGTPSELDSIVTFNVGSYRCASAMAELKSALADSAVDTTLAPELDPAILPASEMLSELSTSTAVAAFVSVPTGMAARLSKFGHVHFLARSCTLLIKCLNVVAGPAV